MNHALLIMIPVTLVLVAGFILGFFWGADSGQFDDLKTPPERMLLEDIQHQGDKEV
jgi:cbb3-type cytochrome oxidase maturation protein